jgi:poly-gamma-glutamate synthesis protein (capsule biosynthesis protein)
MFSQVDDFRRMADAGAKVVSGSQAHFPMAMEFYRQAFIHYGLGNLFFDQDRECCMIQNEWEFMDRYTVYGGRLVSVELLTMMLEDFSRPRPMTASERASFLREYFHLSGWLPVPPFVPALPTLTLTPIALPGSTPRPTP